MCFKMLYGLIITTRFVKISHLRFIQSIYDLINKKRISLKFENNILNQKDYFKLIFGIRKFKN